MTLSVGNLSHLELTTTSLSPTLGQGLHRGERPVACGPDECLRRAPLRRWAGEAGKINGEARAEVRCNVFRLIISNESRSYIFRHRLQILLFSYSRTNIKESLTISCPNAYNLALSLYYCHK